jgi:hypothetical protein
MRVLDTPLYHGRPRKKSDQPMTINQNEHNHFLHSISAEAFGDVIGEKIAEAADKLATWADNAGWRVSLLSAPMGREWNDVAVAGSRT